MSRSPAWLFLAVVIAALVVIDLWQHRGDHEPSARDAALESLFYVTAGVLFGAGVGAVYGSGAAAEYFSGYVIEKSLSIDNVFVWSVVFSSIGTPLRYQHRVLFLGDTWRIIAAGGIRFCRSVTYSPLLVDTTWIRCTADRKWGQSYSTSQ